MHRSGLSLLTPAIAAITLLAGPVSAQVESRFSADQLDQIVAPIALYPDELLSQVFMAATYPIEIVQASRWLAAHPGLASDGLAAALQEERWDASVKSLCGFPEIVERLNDNLDWTQDLGDAFLGQEAELMEAVQRMRRRAADAGSLASGNELVVAQDGADIVVTPADPEIVYVPAYSPAVVYGQSWSYPQWFYPRLFAPPLAYGPLVVFHPGVHWWHGLWGRCDWRGRRVDVDLERHDDFVHRTDRVPGLGSGSPNRFGRQPWAHDPMHRRGVNYRTPSVTSRFAVPGASYRYPFGQARGFGRPRAPGATPAPSPTGPRIFSGSRQPQLDRNASRRGAVNRGTSGRGAGRPGARPPRGATRPGGGRPGGRTGRQQ